MLSYFIVHVHRHGSSLVPVEHVPSTGTARCNAATECEGLLDHLGYEACIGQRGQISVVICSGASPSTAECRPNLESGQLIVFEKDKRRARIVSILILFIVNE